MNKHSLTDTLTLHVQSDRKTPTQYIHIFNDDSNKNTPLNATKTMLFAMSVYACVSARIETVVNVFANVCVFDLEFGTERNVRQNHGIGKFANCNKHNTIDFSILIALCSKKNKSIK